MRSLVNEYRSAGDAAREVLVLQQLMPMLTAISGAERKTRIKEWTVLSGGDGSSDFAQKAIKVNEQLRAATGVDLARVAGRLGSGGPPPQLPKKK